MSENPNTASRSIRDTNALIRALVEQETLGYPFWIGGYVTRCFISDFGHIYFDLTDDDYTISCMIREQVRGKLDFTISNGMDIEVLGTVRVFERKARLEFEVEKIRLLETTGVLPDPQVLAQLEANGLWPKTKRMLPERIHTIAVVTSKQSDALHDFEDTYRKEGGAASIRLLDVRIQGQQAPQEISDAINRVNREGEVDAIVLIRGGGRADDLATFNDYLIAQAICKSTIPIVTGIGHQRNDTVADQVADVQEITPTAAALRLARQSIRQTTTESGKSPWIIYALGGLAILVIFVLVIALFTRQ